MTCSIGRFQLSYSPEQVDQNSDGMTVTFEIVESSYTIVQARRQQLLGLADNPDEPVVPFVWSDDSTFDGFYSVRNVSVGSDAMLIAGKYTDTCTVQLERVTGYSAPLIEMDATSVVRTNSVGITATEVNAVNEVYHSSAYTYTGGGSNIVRTGADGDVYCGLDDAPFTWLTQSFPSIANRYSGMCSIEIQYGGTWYPLVGRQAPSVAAGNWRITNSLVRFTYSTYTGTSATRGGLLVEVYDGGSWRTTITAKLGIWSGGAFSDAAVAGGIGDTAQPSGAIAAAPLRVLRNSPECVVIGFNKENNASQYLTLNAGAMFCTLTTKYFANFEPFCRPVASETASGLGGTAPYTYDPGVSRTANDSNGNRYVILYVGTGSWATQNGGIRAGSSIGNGNGTTFAIGVVLDGSSAVSGNTGRDLAGQFIGQAAWRQRVVVS